MKASEPLIPAISGTTLMTAFSHVISGKENKNFSEPRLLAALEKELLPPAAKQMALPAGWATHYAIGVVFTSLYQYACKQTGRKPTVMNGMFFGAASGLVGIVMWKALFSLHPAPPRTHYAKFYKQLFLAHLIFGATVVLAEKALKASPGEEALVK